MISKSLPFDERSSRFLYEQNQIKYLLLVSPYNKEAVWILFISNIIFKTIMVVMSLIEKYKKYPEYMILVWEQLKWIISVNEFELDTSSGK